MSFLEGKIKVPGTKGEVPKWAAVLGLAATGYLIWRYRTKAAAAPAAAAPAAADGTTADQYPPDGTTGNPADPYSTDPVSGQTYGDEQLAGGPGGDSALLTGSSYPWDGTYGNPNDPYSMDSSTGQTYGTEDFGGGGASSGGAAQNGPPFSTNSQWSQYAIQQLTTVSGLDAGTVTSALGLYLNGQDVSAAQKQLIDDALAVAGPVPVAAASGFPPSIKTTAPSPGGKTYAANPVTGLAASKITETGAEVAWHAAAHAATYTVKTTTGKTTVRTQDTTGHSVHIAGLKHATKYEVTVLARPPKPSAATAHITFTTKRAPAPRKK